MFGPVALFIRIALYWGAGIISASGLGIFDEAGGTLTLQLESIVNVLAGLAVAGGSFVWSRVASKKGGTT